MKIALFMLKFLVVSVLLAITLILLNHLHLSGGLYYFVLVIWSLWAISFPQFIFASALDHV